MTTRHSDLRWCPNHGFYPDGNGFCCPDLMSRCPDEQIASWDKACRGIPDPETTIPELVDALRRAGNLLDECAAPAGTTQIGAEWRSVQHGIRAVLAKLEGTARREW